MKTKMKIFLSVTLILSSIAGCESKMKLDTTKVDVSDRDKTSDTTVETLGADSDKVLGSEFEGASLYMWSQVSGPGTVSFDTPDQPTTRITADMDGEYVVRLTAVMEGGTKKKKDFPFIWDTTPPAFKGLIAANEAQDKVIDNPEIFSQKPIAVLDATEFVEAYYTRILPSKDGKSCEDRDRSSYNQSAIPLINSMPAADQDYIVCVLLIDEAGNSIFGQSDVITRRTTGPGLVVPPLVTTNAPKQVVATINGDGEFQWKQLDGPGTLSFSNTAAADPIISATAEGTYQIQVKVTNAAGNSSEGTVTFVWDVTAPTASTFAAAGPAIMGFIKGSDAASTQNLFTFVPSADTAEIKWTSPLSGAVPQTCDGNLSYMGATTPTATSLVADGMHVFCVRMTDVAGNIGYALSPIITRDTLAPNFISLLPRAEAVDTFVNNAEKASTEVAYTLDANGHNTVDYTGFILSSGSDLCDSNRAYNQTAIAGINQMPLFEGDYFICARLTDSAGNIAYGKSSLIHKDITAPTVNAGSDSLMAASGPLAGVVSGAATSLWSQTSGPGTITFGNAATANSSVSASVDGAYTLTLTATDAAGNSASDDMILTWDTTAPVFTSLALANEASDGFVNSGETSSANPMHVLTASGYDTAEYSTVLSDSPAAVCDASQIYGGSTIRRINEIPAVDGLYTVCVRLVDTAGNTTYGRARSVLI